MKTIITVSFLLYHLCLQASVEIEHVDSACKQARSGMFLIILGPQKCQSLKFLIFLRLLSMVQYLLNSAKIIIFHNFQVCPKT